jgi:hypothetical protein
MASREVDRLARRSSFIFEGTVERTAAATLPAVPVDEATAVVHVDRVFQVPEVLGDQTDRDITVQLLKADMEKGRRALFFASGWLYGDSIAVTEVGRTSMDNPDDLGKQLEQAKLRAEERELLERIAKASLIVVGRVSRIAPAQKRRRVAESEHDARWLVADLEVESVEKGRHARAKRVPLAFPSSDDVQWYWRPKPELGQEGIWILHREKVPGLPQGAFTALDPRDFQPRAQLDHVRRLIARAG